MQNIRRTFSQIALSLAGAASCTQVLAADLAAGKKIADTQCAACHAKANGAEKNWSKTLDPSYPVLAGQRADYLLHSLQAYKSGARKNAIMGGENGQVAKLSKKDLQNLAAYFASLPGPLGY